MLSPKFVFVCKEGGGREGLTLIIKRILGLEDMATILP